MADSAITNYKSLLREIARGLTPQNVHDMAFDLDFDAATNISTGTHFLQEMQNRDKLSEDNLGPLKEALEGQKLLRLVKKVNQFEEARKPVNTEDPLSKTWPSSTFAQQPPPADKQRTQSVTTDPTSLAQPMPPPQARMPQYYPNPQGVAPPMADFHCTVEMPRHPLNPQPYPVEAHPTRDNQPIQMANPNQTVHGQVPQIGIPSRQGVGTPGYIPTGSGDNDPRELQRMIELLQEKVKLQDQLLQNSHHQVPPTASLPSGAQYPSMNLPGSTQPYVGNQHAPDQRSRIHSYPQAVGQAQPQSSTSTHARLSAVKSAPCSTYPTNQPVPPLASEPEACLKPVQTPPNIGDKVLNIPLENVNEGTVKSSSNGTKIPDREAAVNTNQTYQTGRVCTGSEENGLDSEAIAVQPMTLQSMDNTQQLLSMLVGRQLRCSEVDSFKNELFQVRIPEGLHYTTTEGQFVVLNHDTDYRIQLSNSDQRLRCSAVVHYNGRFAGDWTLDPRGTIIIERPATEARKFHFVEASLAPQGSGIREGDPNNGRIKVTFTPEKRTAEPWNDVSRGFSNFGSEPETDYFGVYDSTGPSTNDIQRSVMGPPPTDWQLGATILQGRSSQEFTVSEQFELDESRNKVIELRLVGRR
ncbi:uncharacterized protein LOC110981181 [Acanthaster planci]|uniref:Uncharacterized protein LOC110981181 n=1 Tax=Acanthaster planci TaxID=133434 RepID=A0A8B7YP44_ACAPL|nr:uncharacterized protein LOC110981181 [Acanthaster planci]